MSYDDDRVVEFDEDVVVVLPDLGLEELDSRWGGRAASNDDRLLEERPPHWD